MKAILVLVVLLMSSERARAADESPFLTIEISEEFLNDAVVRAFLGEVLRSGGYGYRNSESAAFLVREKSGEYRCVAWPYDGAFRKQHFRGKVPDRTVAIVHTHPEGIRSGSPGDQATARTLGIPIFVLTKRNIYLVTADGENVPVVRERMWMPKPSVRSRCTAAAEAP